jgi:hypothetical protein
MSKYAAVIAFVLGAMSIVAGAKVIRGWQPGWLVLNWLPVYNLIMGVVSVGVALLIWQANRYALAGSLAVIGIHSIVFLLLLTVFRNVSAAQSMLAMLSRVFAWVVILILMRLRTGS